MRKGNSREVRPPARLVADLRGRYYLWDGAGSDREGSTCLEPRGS